MSFVLASSNGLFADLRELIFRLLLNGTLSSKMLSNFNLRMAVFLIAPEN